MRPVKKKPLFFGFFFFSLLLLFLPGIREARLSGEAKDPAADEVAAAVALYYQGELDAAITGYSRLLDRYPSSAAIRLDLIRLLKEKGEMSEALQHLVTLVEAYPEETGYRLELVITAYLAGEPCLALKHAGLLPETAETYYWQGLILKDLGQAKAAAKAAIESLEKSLALQSYQPTAHYFLGELYFSCGDYEKARDHFLQALKQEPNMTAAFYPLAATYSGLAEYESAYNMLRRAETSLPWNQEIKKAREDFEATHPLLVAKDCREEQQRLETTVLPEVQPAAGREKIPEVRIGLAEKIQEIYVKTGAHFSLTESGTRSKASGPPHTVLIFHRVDNGIEVRKAADGSLFYKSKANRPLVLSYENPGATTAIFNLNFGEGYYWAGREDRIYRGQMEFLPRPDGLTVVNRLNIEEYLYSVVPAEMPCTWPPAALEAQAVAARTYTITNLGRYENRGFDLLSSVLSAYYPGVKSEDPATRTAVDATRGQILTFNGKPITAVYSANSAGFTESSREIWNFDHSYLQAIPDKELPPEITAYMTPVALARWLKERPLTHSSNPAYSSRAAYRWQLWVPRRELEERLARAGTKEIGEILSVTTTGRGPSGRVKEVRIQGTKGEHRIIGDVIRSRLGGLRSNLFVVEPKLGPDGLPEYFIFTGGGWGHGVGMCQSGAAGMAAAGYSCGEILDHYYPGAVLTKRY
ncbi:MAG: SpoIID/LytB domain-containing protein [Clostridia bacterium]|nr:SpoIID/LytB domain-containing protein [Clostridia bacterium]